MLEGPGIANARHTQTTLRELFDRAVADGRNRDAIAGSASAANRRAASWLIGAGQGSARMAEPSRRRGVLVTVSDDSPAMRYTSASVRGFEISRAAHPGARCSRTGGGPAREAGAVEGLGVKGDFCAGADLGRGVGTVVTGALGEFTLAEKQGGKRGFTGLWAPISQMMLGARHLSQVRRRAAGGGGLSAVMHTFDDSRCAGGDMAMIGVRPDGGRLPPASPTTRQAILTQLGLAVALGSRRALAAVAGVPPG